MSGMVVNVGIAVGIVLLSPWLLISIIASDSDTIAILLKYRYRHCRNFYEGISLSLSAILFSAVSVGYRLSPIFLESIVNI